MTEKRFEINNDMSLDDKVETYELSCIVDNDNKTFYFVVDSIANVESFVERLNELHEENQHKQKLLHLSANKIENLLEENEQLKNRVDELEDDNMKYTLSIDKLEEYTKRFMPTKCINEFRDCKTNRYYWLDNEDNFTGALELLNLLDCENEQLKQVLGSILIEVRRDISATNHSGEVKVFVNPNSFDLISDILKKYGALKEWYE